MELTLGCLTWQAKGVSQFQCRDLKEHSRLGVELFMYDRSNVNRKGRTGTSDPADQQLELQEARLSP